MNETLQVLATTPSQIVAACLAAFGASILGGLSGFGTGLVLPVFLVPLVGVANVIPVMAVAMLLNKPYSPYCSIPITPTGKSCCITIKK